MPITRSVRPGSHLAISDAIDVGVAHGSPLCIGRMGRC